VKAKKKYQKMLRAISPSPTITKLASATEQTVKQRIKDIAPSKAVSKAARSLRASRRSRPTADAWRSADDLLLKRGRRGRR
jgi:hypothetical protein